MTFKILVVDDELLLKSLIQQKFKNQIKENALVFSFASNGAEALKVLEEDKEIGIVLLDLNMPVMNGFAFLEYLVKLNRLFRVIIVTAYGDMPNIRKAMNGGASDFITKPIDLEDLEGTIKRNIEKFYLIKGSEVAHDQLIKISKEMEVSRNILMSLIPSNFDEYGPESPVEVYGEILIFKKMGGDFFDFFKLDEDHFGFFIGEVADQGIPAAIFMMIIRTLLHTFALKKLSACECFEKINKLLLVKEIFFAIFVTAFYGILNIKTGEVRYCNAGHPPPISISKKGEMEELGRNEGIALAITDNLDQFKVKYESKAFQLEKGSCMLLYTYGVIETQNASRDIFSEHRLKEFLKNSSSLSPKDIVQGLKNELAEFSKGVMQASDVAILSFRYNGEN